MNDGNQSIVQGLINFDKLRMMSEHVKEITAKSRAQYNFETKPAIQNFIDKPPVERDVAALKAISLLNEKKD